MFKISSENACLINQPSFERYHFRRFGGGRLTALYYIVINIYRLYHQAISSGKWYFCKNDAVSNRNNEILDIIGESFFRRLEALDEPIYFTANMQASRLIVCQIAVICSSSAFGADCLDDIPVAKPICCTPCSDQCDQKHCAYTEQHCEPQYLIGDRKKLFNRCIDQICEK